MICVLVVNWFSIIHYENQERFSARSSPGTAINSVAHIEPALCWPGSPGTGLACNYLQCGKKKNFHILTLKFSLRPMSQYINFNSDIGSTVNSSYVMSRGLWGSLCQGGGCFCCLQWRSGSPLFVETSKVRFFWRVGKEPEIYYIASGLCSVAEQSRLSLLLSLLLLAQHRCLSAHLVKCVTMAIWRLGLDLTASPLTAQGIRRSSWLKPQNISLDHCGHRTNNK